MKTNIPTTEEVLRKYSEFADICIDDAKLAMIEFAKIHVKAALEKASKYDLNCNCDSWESCHNKIDKNLIINSYPEENIK